MFFDVVLLDCGLLMMNNVRKGCTDIGAVFVLGHSSRSNTTLWYMRHLGIP
jgi:hypothetical protein